MEIIGDKIHTITLGRNVFSLDKPLVMGIVNVTPDSFAVRCEDEKSVIECIAKHAEEGADILDIGGCSTRPDAIAVDMEEEWKRVEMGLKNAKKYAPKLPISVDTFRAEIAQRAIEAYGIDIVNDISGLQDEQMLDVLTKHNVAYVLVHNGSINNQMAVLMDNLVHKVYKLHRAGVKDVIVDAGFGFGKTLEENYLILKNLEAMHMLECPILVGLSRKSMLYKLLESTPDKMLNATCVANFWALQKGASILRVHDVKETKEMIKIYQKLCGESE